MTEFADELEIFRTEEEYAQQAFFAYLSVRSLAATDENVLANMNNTPLFWRTTHHAMLEAALLALGRIFDQDPKSDHNIDRLMRVTSNSLHLFTKETLLDRRIADGVSRENAKEYVSHTYELTPDDVRDMRKRVAGWRKITTSATATSATWCSLTSGAMRSFKPSLRRRTSKRSRICSDFWPGYTKRWTDCTSTDGSRS
jgi:hypothetical protein